MTTSNTPWNTRPHEDPPRRGTAANVIAPSWSSAQPAAGSTDALRADALFDLAGAILTAGIVPSPAYLSLARRALTRLGVSLYAALRHRRVDGETLCELLARHTTLDYLVGRPGFRQSTYPASRENSKGDV